MSRRTSTRTLLPKVKAFEIERSRLFTFEPCRKYRADSVPSLRVCGGAKHDVSICRYGSSLEPLPGSHVTTTRAFWRKSDPVRLAASTPAMVTDGG
jgi:hypothetical protein